MNSYQSIRDKINFFVKSLNRVESLSSCPNSTFHRLFILITENNFTAHTDSEINFFSKKYDIFQQLSSTYDDNGRTLSTEPLCEEGLQVFASLLYLRVLMSVNQDASEVDRAKYINVCWKAFSSIPLPEFLDTAPNNLKILQRDLLNDLPAKSLINKRLINHFEESIPQISGEGFRIVPIDVLFYEGPIARAYLEMLYSLRCKPRRIIHLVAENNLITKKKVGSFLPSFLRYKYAATVQSRQIHHWPQYLFRTEKKLCIELFNQLQQVLKIKTSIISDSLKLKSLNHYADKIITCPITSLKDSRFLDFIKQQDASNYLFTGGGFLPQDFFDLKKAKFIHIHPGYLPDIRGADCLLWSVMFSDYPSASCFFLDSDIDTGDVINATFLPKISLPPTAARLNLKMSYRLLYSFIDPWIRSVNLRDTLINTNYFEKIASYPQCKSEGHNFHFMHEKLKGDVIKKILNKDNINYKIL